MTTVESTPLAPEVHELIDRERFASACGKQVRHASMEGAEWEAARLRAVNPSDDFNAYECRHCHTFHVGHYRTPEERAQIREATMQRATIAMQQQRVPQPDAKVDYQEGWVNGEKWVQ